MSVREAAGRLNEEVDDGKVMMEDLQTVVDYVLANVLEDDDEPVTVEWLLQNGFNRDSLGDVYKQNVGRLLHPSNEFDYWCPQLFLNMRLNTRGQVRQLLRLLDGKW